MLSIFDDQDKRLCCKAEIKYLSLTSKDLFYKDGFMYFSIALYIGYLFLIM